MKEHVPDNLPSGPIDGGSHISVLGLLPEYVMLRVLGQEPPGEWQPLERHLGACDSCRAEYDTLRQEMEATYAGALPQPDEAPPPPNLTFLPTQKRAATSGRPLPPRP